MITSGNFSNCIRLGAKFTCYFETPEGLQLSLEKVYLKKNVLLLALK
jgi:hypothetical protein